MTDERMVKRLEQAFLMGKTDDLKEYLADDCTYVSEALQKTLVSSAQITEHIKAVHKNIEDEKAYSSRIKNIRDLLRNPDGSARTIEENQYLNKQAILLYKDSQDFPESVVSIVHDSLNHKIKRILISQNSTIYKVSFFDDRYGEDSPYDVPSTVDFQDMDESCAEEVWNAFSCQCAYEKENSEKNTGNDDQIYVWIKANNYIVKMLESCGYEIYSRKCFDDCIGYQCKRRNHSYAIYMFAWGKEKLSGFDGEFCKKLLDYEFSEGRTVLVSNLNVRKIEIGDEIDYKVYSGYDEDDTSGGSLREVTIIEGKTILLCFDEEGLKRTPQFIDAFNNDSLDMYDCVIAPSNPSFNEYGSSGHIMNKAFYFKLMSLHQEYGNIKELRYISFDELVYFEAPYLEGYGYFSFSIDKNGRIKHVEVLPFDQVNQLAEDIIKINLEGSSASFANIPKLRKVEPFPPAKTERFALKLTFDSGECRKFVLPIEEKLAEDEVISFRHHVFTDKIWKSASIVAKQESKIEGYGERGSGVLFRNGYFLSGLLCYEGSVPYTEPEYCSKIIYEDGDIELSRLWKWKVEEISTDAESGLLNVLISSSPGYRDRHVTIANIDGKRLCALDFEFIGSFCEGRAHIRKGLLNGYIDENMQIVIPMVYEKAEEFVNGRAAVMKDDKWFHIDREGNRLPGYDKNHNEKYVKLAQYHEGMCRVSTLELRLLDFAYYSSCTGIAGMWGFLDETGTEIIPPQYVYAEDFRYGMALVCKGKWKTVKECEDPHRVGRYYPEDERWGAIDKNGAEVIPFKFDEIMHFFDSSEDVRTVITAHYGGWENGGWGVIDPHGNWIVEPVFGDIDYQYYDGMFAFSYEKEEQCADMLYGIYDMNQHKVLFEPQFSDVTFRRDGWINVEIYDEQLGRKISKLIDKRGKEKFPSEYSFIHNAEDYYEVGIKDEDKIRDGLIDRNGKIILPCRYTIPFEGIDYRYKRIIFEENGKQGLMDFEGNVLISADYSEIDDIDRPLITVKVGESFDYKAGLFTGNGTMVLPLEYDWIKWCSDDHVACHKDGYCEMMTISLNQ